MTVTTTDVSHSYHPGAGMLAEAIPFQFLDPVDLAVTHIDGATGLRTRLTIGFIFAGDGRSATGTITATSVWPVADLFLIERRTAQVQEADVRPHEPVPAAQLTRQLDRMAMVAQELGAGVVDMAARAIRLPVGEIAATLPRAPLRARGVLVFDGAGQVAVKDERLFAPGATGPAANTYFELTEFQAQEITDTTSFYDDSYWAFVAGDFTGRTNGVTVVQLLGVAPTIGALVRQTSKVPTLSVVDYRQPGDVDDTPAWIRAQSAVLFAGGGKVRFPAGLGLGTEGAYRISGFWGMDLAASNITIFGDGRGATVIECMGDDEAIIGTYDKSVQRVRIADLTLAVRGGGSCLYANGSFSLGTWTWERVTFNGRIDIPSRNLGQIVCDNGGTLADWYFIDCVWDGCTRMALEVQNHRHDTSTGPGPDDFDKTATYLNIHLIRPRVVNIQCAPGIYQPAPGQSGPVITFPFAFSFSGRGSGIYMEEPYFAGVQGACVELIGVSDWMIRNFTFYAPSMMPNPTGDWAGDALIRSSNIHKGLNGAVDGMYPVTQPGDSIDQLRPEIPRLPLRLDNIDGLDLQRLYLERVTYPAQDLGDINVAQLGVNTPLRRARLSNSVLGAAGPFVTKISGGDLEVIDTTLICYSQDAAEGVRASTESGPTSVIMRGIKTEFNAGGATLARYNGATGYVVQQAATPAATYVAPSGGTTVDDEARASLAQLAADLTDLQAKLTAAGVTA